MIWNKLLYNLHKPLTWQSKHITSPIWFASHQSSCFWKSFLLKNFLTGRNTSYTHDKIHTNFSCLSSHLTSFCFISVLIKQDYISFEQANQYSKTVHIAPLYFIVMGLLGPILLSIPSIGCQAQQRERAGGSTPWCVESTLGSSGMFAVSSGIAEGFTKGLNVFSQHARDTPDHYWS